ncbi:hypothetical protein DFJ58DRAFT_731076 [Suillus subalutaceus]|uniref:uncharacterized protein n=1 Tax=Suillus subalutaceus TaxID=48586 RepID=UPI001B86C839|nr:uncharacterized protein DFJ58DRAFT_731076 [Suillus subalutaceus]KAG1844804.1 hypothetical protein DFJ58DRAFT_731076 [Suillus subalutaceus]
MPNQWKLTPPLDVIRPHILCLWKACQTDKQIIAELQQHFDTSHYGLRFSEDMGLRRMRQQHHTVETIRETMTDLHMTYPQAGTREMLINTISGLGMVSASILASSLFSGRIMWMRVWHSNQNPQLILSYYLDTLDMLGYMPMVTQSDPGSENFGIANAHTMLRQWHDPVLQGTLQHHWMRNKKNVMPEITWSQMRRRFMPGFESLLDHGVTSGWYNSNNTLQMMVFRCVFIPWLQRELDTYQDRVNNSQKRRDRNKILPHGVPNLIYQSANNFGALDFKITVEHEALYHVCNLYIDRSHVVFDLVPQSFEKLIQRCYEELGRPSVTRQSAWDVYLHLLDMLQVDEEIPSTIEDVEEDLPLLENHQDLPYHEEDNGAYYMGGVGGGLGLGDKHLHQLERLVCDDEPETTSSIDEDVGLDHDGLVIWEFSEDSDGDADAMDEW